MKRITDIFEKITKKDLLVITSAIYVAIILLYELFYCNYQFFLKIVPNYNFSIYRLIMYIAIYFIIYKFKDKFMAKALETFKTKWKSVLIISVLAITVIMTVAIINLSIKYYLSIAYINLMISLLLILLFTLYVSNDIIKNIIIIGLTFGISFSISITFNNQLDEKRHFLASYSIALGEFDLTNPAMDKSVAKMPRMMNLSQFAKFFSEKPSNEITREKVEVINDSPNGYLTISYIISGIGIFIAKTLGGSVADIYITGRIFNLLGYVLFTSIALKILPYKKKIAFSIFCMPMLLALASVYSVDGIGVALITMFVAYCLKIHEQENINIKELLMAIFLAIVAITVKSVGYVGIAIVALILPIKKIIKQNKKYMKYMVVFFIIVFIGVAYIYIESINEEGDPWNQGVNSPAQFREIIENPIKYAKVLLRHTVYHFTNIPCVSFLNAPMFFNTTYMSVFLLMIAYILFISITDSSKQLKIRTRVVFIITYFIVFFMASTAMYIAYTPVGANYIDGFQLRYTFPILFILFSSISIRRFQADYSKFKFMNLYSGIISSTFLIISAIDAII